ncbi:recombinase family protein [Actinoplanes sp. ATCC 53533]|uniref:recombinase family protein n=1 Tax=Actinoplanes sp. ATCC 53533 TaxID=1288362 RepID=UPI003512A6AE
MERIRALAAAGHTARQIADALNADGLRPPKRTNRFGVEQVRTILHQRGIRTQHHNTPVTVLAEHEWSVAGLAAALRMPTATAYTWIYRGWVTAHRASDDKHWIITADPTELDRLRQLRDRPPGYHQHRRWNPPNPPEPSQGDQE